MCRYLFTALMCGCGDVSYICPTYKYIQLLTIKHPSYIFSLLLIYLVWMCKSVQICVCMYEYEYEYESMCVCRCIVCWNNIQLCAVVHICGIATCCRLHPDSVVAKPQTLSLKRPHRVVCPRKARLALWRPFCTINHPTSLPPQPTICKMQLFKLEMYWSS